MADVINMKLAIMALPVALFVVSKFVIFARLAGVPHGVIQAAQHKLQELEQSPVARRARARPSPQQSDLFSEPAVVERVVEKRVRIPGPVEEALARLDIDSLSPRAALETLYTLRVLLTHDKAAS